MTSSSPQTQNFIQYILSSYIDAPTSVLVSKHLSSFQAWAHSNNINNTGDQMNLPASQQMSLQAERYVKGLRKLRSLEPDNQEYYRLFMNADVFFETGGFFLNPSAFTKTLQMLGDEEQVKEWSEKVLAGKVIGAYAQTELGHGSNVQGLETTAHYNETTETWTFDSPKPSSAKFWPGLLGIFSTSVILQAKAYVKNKSIGVQTFVFSIRDENLNNLEGVDAGEMGAKLGMAFLDHGFLRFSNFVQPRRAMLMRYIKVEKGGEVIGLDNKQALKYGYGSMLNLRVFLTSSFGSSCYKNLRNACNYFNQANLLENPEVKELLLHGFSVALGIIIANKQTSKIFNSFTQYMKSQQYTLADELLNQCHIISSTLKAVTSWKTMEISKSLVTFHPILALRNTFVPKGFTDMVPSVTYEGDNSVLLQLTAKYLLKQEQAVNVNRPEKINCECLDSLVTAFHYVYTKELQRNKTLISKQMQKGADFLVIWNQLLQAELLNLSKFWGRYILVKFYNESYKEYTGGVKDLVYKIGLTFVHSLVEDSKELFGFYDVEMGGKRGWTEKFTRGEYEMLRNSSHWGQLPKYELGTRVMEERGRQIEEVVWKERARL